MPKGDFSVARIEKRTRASVGKFERHIERKNESYENMNVDLSRTPMNVHFQGCGELTYNEHQMCIRDRALLKKAQAIGISKRVLDEAKKELNVRSLKEGSQWYWELPEKTE